VERGRLVGPGGAEEPIDELVLFDTVEPAVPPGDVRVRALKGDVANTDDVAEAIDAATASVFHLAAVVSGEAEENFDLGMLVNVDGTLAVLEACRALPNPPRVVFSSSVAAFGGDLPAVIEDTTPLNPRTSYGNQKAIGEFLVKDYTRKGFIDGRALRLPTIVVRGGKPNLAASGFASSIVREPLSGRDYACPVSPESRMWMLSPRRVVAALIHAHDLPAEAWGVDPVLNLPGLSASMGEAVAAMGRVAGEAPVKRVTWEHDAFIQGMVDGWPNDFNPAQALAMGFAADASMDEIVQAFIEDDLGGKVD
jgi:nucleoside-diphosphate-sugar epimerase